MKKLVAVVFAVTMLGSAGTAQAGKMVYSGTRGYETIQKGLWQIGFDNMLLVNYMSSTNDTTDVTNSSLRVAYMAGLTPRYFVINNLSVGLSLNAFYELNEDTREAGGTETVTTASDTGFMGLAVVNYNVRIGHSLFIRPGVGAGYFYGTRERPNTAAGAIPGSKLESTISGPAALLDLTLQYFAGPHFSMRAGPILVMRFGSDAPEVGEAQSYTQIDAGFTAGLAYSF